MSRTTCRRWCWAALLVLLAIGAGWSSGQNPPKARWIAPTSLFDPRLENLRRASVSWDMRIGPEREVVDQVCLVPDLPTFFEVIATWDHRHYFPILIDDVESSFRFIRAFKPARIVRFPRNGTPIPEGKLWDRAVAAVGSSWTDEAKPGSDKPTGEAVPKGLGPTPPGVVVSSPSAPMLAGAVALAAGRFQPLLRIDSDKKFVDLLSFADFQAFNQALTSKVRAAVPNFDRLGDECDFLTIAGDWPYRYTDPKGGPNAVDDRIGRDTDSDQRWAFAGRLLGDAPDSVYRAMCSLFLQPESAVMFNGYDESSPPWSDYAMRAAAIRLQPVMPTSNVSGEKSGGLEGWHEMFDPSNRFALILINSHGSPKVFNIRGGPAASPDIPRSIPSAVLMIHSFSAADPTDPATIAGRWLANGAFIFFGSMNEPFLNSFRNPQLVGNLIGERLPYVAAVRVSLAEPFGQPWRLVFLGDPLYRLRRREEAAASRLARWEPTADWPSYAEEARPARAADEDLLFWAIKVALARLQGGNPNQSPGDDLIDAVQAIRRGRLSAEFRPIHDALLVEVLLQARKRTALRARIAAIPEAERTPSLRRCYETLLAIDLHLTLAHGDLSRARATWVEIMKTDTPAEFKQQATARVGRLADTPVRRHDWSLLLRSALQTHPKPPDSDVIKAEWKRVQEVLKNDQ